MHILLQALVSDGHDIVYWIGERGGENMTPPGTIFHDHFAAWDAKPAEAFKGENIPPPSASLIRARYDTASLVLTVMNKHYDKAPVDERKHIYYTMLAYWNFVLEKCKPDCIVLNIIPHSIYSNILYDLAHARGIPTLCFEDAWVARRLLTYRDFWKGSDLLRSQIARTTKTTVTPDDLGEELREYWNEQMQTKSGVVPRYMTMQKSTGQGLGLLKHRVHIIVRALREGTIFRLLWGYFRRIGAANLKKEYARVVQDVDFTKPFVYFPLHWQPEQSTSPQGGVYHDQILVAETIAAALPPGWELYIKEHPSQWWVRTKERYSSARWRGYYERLADIPRVRLVPVPTSTFELTERSQAVATITGTAGWEAILRGKCPLVFGIPWWRECPGVFRIDSVDACKDAFRQIQGGAKISQDDVLRFLKALEEASIRAYIAPSLEENPRYTLEENMRMLAEHVCKELRAL